MTFGITGNVLGAIIPFAFMLITFFIGKNLWALGYKIGKESVKSIFAGRMGQGTDFCNKYSGTVHDGSIKCFICNTYNCP